MKCVKCGKEATYDSPDSFCSFHWYLWWYGGVFGENTDEEFEQCNPSEDERFWFNIVKANRRLQSEQSCDKGFEMSCINKTDKDSERKHKKEINEMADKLFPKLFNQIIMEINQAAADGKNTCIIGYTGQWNPSDNYKEIVFNRIIDVLKKYRYNVTELPVELSADFPNFYYCFNWEISWTTDN